DDQGQSRTFHPDGKEEVLQLDGVPVGIITRREPGGLVVLYKVEQGRELRYTYSSTANPSQLIVDVQFIERGGGDKVRRVYEPSKATETIAASAATAHSPAPAKPAEIPAPGASE